MLFKCQLWPGSICKCDVTIYPKSDDSRVVVLSELPWNEGTSLARAFEVLLDQVCRTYYLNPERVACLEHVLEPGSLCERWFLVHFDVVNGKVCNPRWQKVNESFVQLAIAY